MNKIIKEQLSKVTAVKLEYDQDTTQLVIPRTYVRLNSSMAEGDVYVIEIEDFLLNPSQNLVLVNNWNAGQYPTHKRYKVEVLKKMNNMLKLNGIPIENDTEIFNESFYGWLPDDGFKIISKE